jgi:ADP-ribosylglycohydrolase
MIYATLMALQSNGDYKSAYIQYGNEYTDVGYSPRFQNWLMTDDDLLTDSYGNGAATRAIPIAAFSQSLNEALCKAQSSASVSHCSPEGIDSTCAVIEALFGIKHGMDSETIQASLKKQYFDIPDRATLESLAKDSEFESSSDAKTTVPVAISIGLMASSFEDAMRLGLYMGGDVDSILTIAGAIAAERHGIHLSEPVVDRLLSKLKINYPEIFIAVQKFFNVDA